MSTSLDIGIEGIGVWADGLPGWPASRDILAADAAGSRVINLANSTSRPAPSLLAATERRRAPDSVLLAVEVAQQACIMAGRDPRELPTVFASAHGDLAISDYLCATLARAPLELSPTRFHNSVHNAPSGYWTIAAGCMASSTAISAGATTFGAGLLEAILVARSEASAVLLVAYDVAAVGPLADVVPCHTAFAVALVMSPMSPRAIARLRVQPAYGVAELAPGADVPHALHNANPAACSLPLLRALARREQGTLSLAAGVELNLHMEILP